MGAGIAHAFLVKGADVVVVERDEASAQAGRERVESSAAKSIERDPQGGNLDEMVSRLSVSVDYAAFGDRELVVEAVPEDWALKVAALRAGRGAAHAGHGAGLEHVLAVRLRAGGGAGSARRTSWGCISSTRSPPRR